jgi:hypothetical protein
MEKTMTEETHRMCVVEETLAMCPVSVPTYVVYAYQDEKRKVTFAWDAVLALSTIRVTQFKVPLRYWGRQGKTVEEWLELGFERYDVFEKILPVTISDDVLLEANDVGEMVACDQKICVFTLCPHESFKAKLDDVQYGLAADLACSYGKR